MYVDFLIVGGGISGLALAAELAAEGTTLVVEAEPMPGTHATGRSAALFTPNFGPPLVCALSLASKATLMGPQSKDASVSFLRQRGMLSVAGSTGAAPLVQLAQSSSELNPIHSISVSEALELAPVLRSERVSAACYEPGVMDMDVDAILQYCLKGLQLEGGQLVCNSRVSRCERDDDGWAVQAGDLSIKARIIINAAGAWASDIALLAGAQPIGLIPKRRTAIVVNGPGDCKFDKMPAVDMADTGAYFKPEANRIMASLGDEVPVPAHDVQAEDLDVARIVDCLETETLIDVRTAPHAWAGLRTFTKDNCPVVGFDAIVPDFFWLAGQGGYGIMMALSLARASRGLIVDRVLPDDLVDVGITEDALAPGRVGSLL